MQTVYPAGRKKVRVVYECLDTKSWKAAVKHCNAILQKGTSELVRVLKAQAVAKLGNWGEALHLCQEVNQIVM